MKQLELFWELVAPLMENIPANEQKTITDSYRRLTNRVSQIEKNYNLAIQNRAAVHSLLKKTSDDLLQRYQILFEYSGTAMAVIEYDGTISLVNSYFEHLFGYSRDELENKRNIKDFIENTHQSGIVDYHKRRMQGNPSVPTQYEAQVVSREGTVLDALITVGKFPNVQQSVISLIDTTERKQAERELEKEEEKYRILLQNITDGVVVHEMTQGGPGNFLEVNNRICDMLGYSREEMLTLSIHDMCVPEQKDKISDAINDLFSKNSAVFETEFLTKSRERILVEISARLIDLQGKQTILAVIRDITEKKIIEQEMEFYTAELMHHARDLQLVNDKINLLNRITRHDINNQMVVIQGIVEIIQDEFPDPALQDYVKMELNAVKNIQEQILFTKEYQDIGVQSPGWFDVRELIESSQSNLPLSDISTTIDMQGIEVYADPLIKKVFYTLFENAIRHGETITEISFSIQELSDGLLILCEDNGVGVPSQHKADIFTQKYFRNTGFGLFLSVSILMITGITITENGASGQGSRFEIKVPKGSYRFT